MRKLVFLMIIILSGCATLNPVNSYEKTLARATAEPWIGGAYGGGRGATFRLNFYKLGEPLNCDTLWVNSIPLETELTTVGDTTYVSAFYFTEHAEEKTLANAADYQGRLRLLIKEEVHYLDIDNFEVLQTVSMP